MQGKSHNLLLFLCLTVVGCNQSTSERTTIAGNGDSNSTQATGKGSGNSSENKKKSDDSKSGGENEGLTGYLASPKKVVVVENSDGSLQVTAPAGTVKNTKDITLGWMNGTNYQKAELNSGKISATVELVLHSDVTTSGGFDLKISKQVEQGLVIFAGKLTLGTDTEEFATVSNGYSGVLYDWDGYLTSLPDDGVWGDFRVSGYCQGDKLDLDAEGDGSGTNPFMICTVGQLERLLSHTTPLSSNGMNISIQQDLDFDQVTWTPANSLSDPFEGVIKGNGSKMINLHLNGQLGNSVGLFDTISNGQIHDLIIEGSIKNCIGECGILAGKIINSELKNVHVKLSSRYTTPAPAASVGGVAGSIGQTTLNTVTAQVDIVDGFIVGGIAASGNTLSGESWGVLGQLTGAGMAGGLFGIQEGAMVVEKVYVHAEVVGQDGAAALWNNNSLNGDGGIPNNCLITGMIEPVTQSPQSYIINDANLSGPYKCIWPSDLPLHSGDVNHTYYHNQSELEIEATYIGRGYDFADVWKFDAQISGYPVFKTQPRFP